MAQAAADAAVQAGLMSIFDDSLKPRRSAVRPVTGGMPLYNLKMTTDRRLSDVGGTPGGLGPFLIGLVMSCVGGYLLTSHVIVTSGYWNLYGANSFGISLIPFLFGVAMLFWNGRSVVGWLLTIAGVLFIFSGILMNLHIYFQPTSLFNTLIMLVLVVGGVGLIARSTRSTGSA